MILLREAHKQFLKWCGQRLFLRSSDPDHHRTKVWHRIPNSRQLYGFSTSLCIAIVQRKKGRSVPQAPNDPFRFLFQLS
jgi:hypothetical protein